MPSASQVRSPASSDTAAQWVAGLIGTWVIIQPWLIGGVYWWSEAINAGVGGLAMLITVCSSENRHTLVRFPIFWLGLAFCLYVLCQALNPWGRGVQHPGIFIFDVFTIQHIAWLPSGILSRYWMPNSWRTLIFWLGPWLSVCAWWAAVRRRRTGRRLMLAIFINGVVMASLVAFERIHVPAKILWFYSFPGMDPNSTRYGSFVDHSKTAVFLYLSMAAGFYWACRLQARARERGRDDGLTWVVLLGCLIIFMSFFALGSRAGLAVAVGVFVGSFVILLGAALLARDRSPGLWLGSLVLVLAVVGAVLFEFYHPQNGTLARIEYLHAHPEDDIRGTLRKETLRMIQQHPWLGWGGGAYRYVSQDYFTEDYAFTDIYYQTEATLHSDWAHSDWLQLPFEFGYLGAGLLLVMLIYLFARSFWVIRRLGSQHLVVLLACAGMLAHAAVDFPAYNASLVLLFGLLMVSTLKTAELEFRRTA